MKRDKIIHVRVNEDLYQYFKEEAARHYTERKFGGCKYKRYSDGIRSLRSFKIGDLLEEALLHYLQEEHRSYISIRAMRSPLLRRKVANVPEPAEPAEGNENENPGEA